ncbi:hypothetical protein ABTZ03_31015 [Kitasatospora sp. NPDC096077]|uniref:hypothetical protein n=1 Tax=Kitasatospora sp. NPDC096077 TaxID=3155544 RepID=UPI00331F0DDA
MAIEGITALATFSDKDEVPGTYKLIDRNINSKGKALYLAYEHGLGSALTNLVFHLAWAQKSTYYTVLKKNLNDGVHDAIPFYLAYTKETEEGSKAITDIDVIKVGDPLPQGFHKVDLNLNISVPGGEALNLIFKTA